MKLEQYFLNPHLSKAITRLDMQDDVAETIRLAMQDSDAVGNLTKELSGLTTEEDIAGNIREIERIARRLMAGDVSEFSDFQRLVRGAKDDIAEGITAADPERYKGVLDKAYNRVIKAAEDLNETALDNAIERAIDKKATYNAYRIAHQETNKAYNQGVFTQATEDDDCVGMHLDLSDIGNNCDECEDLAGDYPIDNVPEVPVHVGCNCLLTPMYDRHPDFDDYDGDTMEKIPDDLVEELME